MLRGHHAYDHFRALSRAGEVGGRLDRLREREARQKMPVDPLRRDIFVHFGLVGPEANGMLPFTSQHNRQGCAPGSRADNGNPAHPRFAPSFDSVPATTRPIFCRCFQTTNSETRAIGINCTGSMYSWRTEHSAGKAAAAATEPIET